MTPQSQRLVMALLLPCLAIAGCPGSCHAWAYSPPALICLSKTGILLFSSQHLKFLVNWILPDTKLHGLLEIGQCNA